MTYIATLPQAQTPSLVNFDQRLGPIEYRRPASLKPYANNPRKHPEKQIVKLMASINQFGFALPVLVDGQGTIIAGQARVEAASRLGLAEIPVLVADKWTASEVRAFRLADNRLAELSSWDESTLAIELAEIIEIGDVNVEMIGWETAEIDVMMDHRDESTSESNPVDVIPSLPKQPVSRVGDLWGLGVHRLLCGSSLDAANWDRLMAGETAQMLFTDAPYNVRIQGNVSGLGKHQHAEFAQASGEMSSEEFSAFLATAFRCAAVHLKDGAVLDLFMDWRHLSELFEAVRINGLTPLNLCVWNKSNGGMGSLYRSKHELVLIARKGKAAHTNNVQLGKHGRYRTNVWDYPGANSFGGSRDEDLADHPTVKPVALIADAIRDVTHHREIVLDGFMGSGSTILAAELTKRRAYGIELEPGYVDVAIRRWEEASGQQAILVDTGETFADASAARLPAVAPSERCQD